MEDSFKYIHILRLEANFPKTNVELTEKILNFTQQYIHPKIFSTKTKIYAAGMGFIVCYDTR